MEGRKRKSERRLNNILVGTARIAHPHPTQDCAGMEPGCGKGGEGRGSGTTNLLCAPGREAGVVLGGGTVGGAYKRVSGMWGKWRLVVLDGDGKYFVLLVLSGVGVC